LESIKIGTATGGNLRYMTAIAPLVALLAAFACDRYKYLSKKTMLFVGAGLYVVFVAVFLSYPNNNIRLLDEVNEQTGEDPKHDYVSLLFTLVSAGCLFALSKQKQVITALTVAAVLFVLFSVRPFKQTPEDVAMETVTNSIIAKGYTDRNAPIYVNHVLFKYFYDKKKHGIYKNQFFVDSLTMQTAPVGSIIIWESHYSYRPKLNKNAITTDYFQRRPHQYNLLQNRISTDNRFQVVLFEKTAP
jgi:Ca2+/Na+ antiporter